MRAAIFGVLVAGVMVYAPAQNARLVRPAESSQVCPQPVAKIDLVFIIDRSGSFDMNLVGQSYNVQIDGVLRALRDRSVIPRDGSVAVAVETFAGSATIQVPFKQIDTAADAEAIAAMVESLRCATADCTPTGSCPVFGSNPASNYAPAITTAGDYLIQSRRPFARQALLLSSDGQPSDPCDALEEARRAGHGATSLGIQFELDLILLAVDPQQTKICEATGEPILQIVFPQPGSDLPGAVLAIGRGDSNKPCASLDDSAVKADHDRQVREFAELTRRVLRSQPATRFLTVNTNADTDPDMPVIGATLSLRQAIELANRNCGATTITFNSSLRGQTIRPSVPLPALTEPDIRICGCDEMNCGDLMDTEKKCDPFLTIDGTDTNTSKGEQHSDGILIGSNHDVVRGLRIIRFKGAGVGIDPGAGAPFRDVNVGFNLITRNVFENNVKAGVRVIETPAAANTPVFGHNIGNTILGNTILDSLDCATPIDLGGDGRTDNDLCDTDEGPNTLLNSPYTMTVTQSPSNGVTVRGSVCDPNCAAGVCPANLIGAVVEIFAITRFGTNCGGGPGDGVTDIQVDLDNRVITGVMPLATGTTDANGSFTISGVGVSPTCGYAATVTDLQGNTSELMLRGAGFAKAKTTNLDFKEFAGVADPNDPPQSGTFTIENTGFAPLAVRFVSITRDDFPKKRSDDSVHSVHFAIQPVILGGSQPVTIQPGQTQTITATFNPVVPGLFKGGEQKLPASLDLPDTVNSTLTLEHNGCTGSDSTVSLTGHVKSTIILIDPDDPQNGHPLVTLTRSGDVFTVVYSIYDSTLDVNSVKYEFFDQAGGLVDLNQPEHDLSRVVKQARADGTLRLGQSFSIRQTFTNARQHRDVTSVTVTVFDEEGSNAKASGAMTSVTSTASIRSLLDARGGVLVLPAVKFETASHRKARRAESATSSSATPQRRTLVRPGGSSDPRARSQARERSITNG